jgi:hypothetical protein
MDKTEAMQIIESELELFRTKSYSELVSLVDSEPTVGQKVGPSGKEYQFEIMVYWDDKLDGDVRVSGNVDDGAWRAYFPLGTSFIKGPDNTFVGE